jgi:hypothetical protein
VARAIAIGNRWGEGARKRLEPWEKYVYKQRAYNALGKEVHPSVRRWKDERRAKPPNPLFQGDTSEELQRRYIVDVLDAMIKEWRKMLAQGLEGRLRKGCRTAWMKRVLDVHYALKHYVLIHYVLIHYVLIHYVLIHYVLIHYVLIHYVLIHYVLIHYVLIHYVLIH